MANANLQQAEKITFDWRRNARGLDDYFNKGKHVNISQMKDRVLLKNGQISEDPMMRYSIKEENIPHYPTPVEFQVSNVAHVTEEPGFEGILGSQLFRPPESEYSWWYLKINEEEIQAAETSYVESNVLNQVQRPFLRTFTTSPLFQMDSSRYGNYRFTFPICELMQLYKEQNCEGKDPVLRVYETITYKQEIVYVVLIHSPEYNEHFEKKYPLLEKSEFVRYHDGKIIWKAQAICETHRYEFVSGEVRELNEREKQFYVWDQVSLIFHLPKHTEPCKALEIPREQLIKALEYCDIATRAILRNKSFQENRSLQAKLKIAKLKKELEKKEKEEDEDKEGVKIEMEVDPVRK